MLHVAGTGRIDAGAVGRAIRLVRSTSPSSLLLASLDGARRQLAVHGEALLHETIAAAAATRAKLATTPGCAMIGEEFVGRAGRRRLGPAADRARRARRPAAPATRSPMRCATPMTCRSSWRRRRRSCCVVGIGQPVEALERFAGDVDETVKRDPRGRARVAGARPRARRALEQRDGGRAARGLPRRAASVVAVDDAVGRISCESIAGYPPGIPALLPGERITAETVAYLRELVAAGRACTARRTPPWRRSTSSPPVARRRSSAAIDPFISIASSSTAR